MGVAELLKLYWSWKHTLASFFNVNVYSSPRQCLSLCLCRQHFLVFQITTWLYSIGPAGAAWEYLVDHAVHCSHRCPRLLRQLIGLLVRICGGWRWEERRNEEEEHSLAVLFTWTGLTFFCFLVSHQSRWLHFVCLHAARVVMATDKLSSKIHSHPDKAFPW
jgi:hypothetical protein